MLSVNYIINFLEEKQLKIDNFYYDKINEFEKNKDNLIIRKNINHQDLPFCFDLIFRSNNIINFYYDSKLYKNRSHIFTLFNSLLSIENILFNLNNEKEVIIKELIKKMDDDIFCKDLYNKFNYNKNIKFSKSNIQMVLKNAFQFKSCDKFNILKEYLSDYLGINIYIFNIENNLINFTNSEFYLSKYYNNDVNKFLPSFILIYENEIYKPVLMHNMDTSILKYSHNNDILDNIWNYFKINDCENKINIEIKNDIQKNMIY